MEDPAFRVRNSIRNSAFADFLYFNGTACAGGLRAPPRRTTGLEGCIESKLPAAITKYSRARMWYGAECRHRSRIHKGWRADTSAMIREGRYDSIEDII